MTIIFLTLSIAFIVALPNLVHALVRNMRRFRQSLFQFSDQNPRYGMVAGENHTSEHEWEKSLRQSVETQEISMLKKMG